MGKKLNKFKHGNRTLGQHSHGGNQREVQIWPERYKRTVEIEEPCAKPQYRFVYKWTFTINWAEVILWTIVLVTLYLLR